MNDVSDIYPCVILVYAALYSLQKSVLINFLSDQCDPFIRRHIRQHKEASVFPQITESLF